MKTKILLAFITLLLLSATSYADDIPKIVTDGLNAYKTAGFGEASRVWLKGSPLESDKTTTTNIQGSFTQVESMCGKMINYEILKDTKISRSSNRVYVAINHEKCPVFIFFDCYRTSSAWIIPMMRFHTEADKILPNDFFRMK